MPKKIESEYCLWGTNCVSLRLEKSFEGCELYRCCYTCPKKLKCEYPCTDREQAPHSCPYISSKEDAEAKTTYRFKGNLPATSEQEEIQVKSVAVSKPKGSPKKTSSNKPKSKTLWKISNLPVPTSVKDLAAQTGATYARANYLIKTKKMSFADALKVLNS